MATVYRELHPEMAQFLAATFPQIVRVAGTNFPVSSLAFDAAADEAAFWKLRALNYGSGNLTLDLDWYADTASSGVVRWGAAIAAITPDTDTQDVETDGLATENTVDDTHLGTTNQRLHRATVTISNLDSIAAGDDVFIRIRRVGSNAADTMTGDAMLLLATLSYSDT
jgi:hypothetical protein